MKKVQELQKAIDAVSGKIQALEVQQAEQQAALLAEERKIADVELDEGLGLISEEAAEKKLTQFKKGADKIKADLDRTTQKLESLKAARVRRLDDIREDAAKAVLKEKDAYLREKAALMQDIKEMRMLIMDKIHQAYQSRKQYEGKVVNFCKVSQQLDQKYGSSAPPFKVSSDLPDNFHTTHLANYTELKDIMESGKTPADYNAYLINGKVK
jgi:hypothetical protein